MYLERVVTSAPPRGQALCIVGTSGIGKTTIASQLTWQGKPALIVDVEGGADFLPEGVSRTPICTRYETVLGIVHEAANAGADFPFGWIVIDSIDWAERRLHETVCERHSKGSMADFGYGKGYEHASREMETLLRAFDGARAVGISVLLIAHDAVVKIEPPDGDSYSRWQPSLHKSTLPMVTEWCDHILFLHYDRLMTRKDEGFGRNRTVAVGEGERIFAAQERPAWLAKNRCGMPPEFSATVEELQNYLEPKK